MLTRRVQNEYDPKNWSKEEVLTLITYIQAHRNIEKPGQSPEVREEQLKLDRENCVWAKELAAEKMKTQKIETDRKWKMQKINNNRKWKLVEKKVENDFVLKQLELEQKERLYKLHLELQFKRDN